MKKTRKWEILSKINTVESNFTINDVVTEVLKNRGIKTKKELQKFLHPKLSDITIKTAEIDTKQLQKALKRLEKATQAKEKIIVFGDYDVDGITGTAVLWETL